jgi:hypothetical protein
MTILLREGSTGLYYAGPGQWVTDRLAAKDFSLIEEAVNFNRSGALGATHVVLAYDSPACNLTLPIAKYDVPPSPHPATRKHR